MKQAQRQAAGDRSGRKCSKKYVFMSKNSVPMVKSVTFGSLGPLLPFSKAYPPKLIKNGNFQKWYFLLFSFVTLSLPAKNYVSITKSVNLAPWAPFALFKRAPELIKNENFQK